MNAPAYRSRIAGTKRIQASKITAQTIPATAAKTGTGIHPSAFAKIATPGIMVAPSLLSRTLFPFLAVQHSSNRSKISADAPDHDGFNNFRRLASAPGENV
jgi:hypothetical protein